MPISVKTMRNIWDTERRTAKIEREPAVFSRPKSVLGKQTEDGLAKTRNYFLEYLELKKVVMDFFPDYEKYLNDAGFSKI